jgi:CBS domain-containing protein
MSTGHESEGSYVMPRPEHARVADAMRHGLVKCGADSTLRDAARTMSSKHVHMIAVSDPSDGTVTGTVSDMGLLEALLEDPGLHRSLGEIADPHTRAISSDESLLAAARAMRDLGTSHLLVRDAHNGHPIGVISTLDVAGILAWGEA